MRKVAFLISLAALILLAQACNAQPTVIRTAEITPTLRKPIQTQTSTALPGSELFGTEKKDVTYCSIRSTDLKMDVTYPREGEAPFPVVVFIHGGGWSQGDKTDWTGAPGTSELADRGYVLISINYRMAPEYRFPSMIEDSKCAIRSIRANASELAIDPERIGVMGDSAGGHLVALLGTADETAGWDAGEGYDQAYTDQSSQVQAVVDLYGPADLPRLFAVSAQNLAQSVFGVRRSADPFLQEASPIHHITSGDAPFLILHGTQDSQVSLEQSQALDTALNAAGVDSTLVVVEGAGHGFPRGGDYSPGYDELSQKIAEFFDKYLGK